MAGRAGHTVPDFVDYGVALTIAAGAVWVGSSSAESASYFAGRFVLSVADYASTWLSALIDLEGVPEIHAGPAVGAIALTVTMLLLAAERYCSSRYRAPATVEPPAGP
jgi:hypothetical protein